MRRFRFHIGSLLVLVLLMGVGFAALREANDVWDGGVFTLTLGVLLISILLAVHRMGSRRAFWIGFALFGWSYIGLASIPQVAARLVTTKALAYLDSKIPGRDIVIQAVFGINSGSIGATLAPSHSRRSHSSGPLTTRERSESGMWPRGGASGPGVVPPKTSYGSATHCWP